MSLKRLLLIALLISTIVQGSFIDLVKGKLSNDPSLETIMRDFKSSKINLETLGSFATPYISLSGDVNMSLEDIKSSSLIPAVRWNAFGTSVLISNEFDVAGYEWKGFSVGISGDIDSVISYTRDFKKREAVVLLKKFQVINTKNSLILEAFSDVFNWKISILKKPILLRKLEINEKNLKDMKGKDFSEEEILKKQREILSIQKELISVESKSKENFSENDFQEAFELAKKMAEASCVISREDIEAYKLYEEAYKEEEKWLALEDLPQISFSVSYKENPPKNVDNWSISLSFAWNIWDRGEKESKKLVTASNKRYYRLKYENTLKDLKDTLENIKDQIRMKEIDLETAKINQRISKIELERAKKAYENGLISEEDLELYKLSFEEDQINLLRTILDLLILKLQYLSTCGADLSELLGVNQ